VGKEKEDERKKGEKVVPVSTPDSVSKMKNVVQLKEKLEGPNLSPDVAVPSPVASIPNQSKAKTKIFLQHINTPRYKEILGKAAVKKITAPLISKSPSPSSGSVAAYPKKTQEVVKPSVKPSTSVVKLLKATVTIRGPKLVQSPRLSSIEEVTEISDSTEMTDQNKVTIEDIIEDDKVPDITIETEADLRPCDQRREEISPVEAAFLKQFLQLVQTTQSTSKSTSTSKTASEEELGDQSIVPIEREAIVRAVARKIRSKEVKNLELYDFTGGTAYFGQNKVDPYGINKMLIVNYKGQNFLFEGFEIPFELKELFLDFTKEVVAVINVREFEKEIHDLTEKLKKARRFEQMWYKQEHSAL